MPLLSRRAISDLGMTINFGRHTLVIAEGPGTPLRYSGSGHDVLDIAWTGYSDTNVLPDEYQVPANLQQFEIVDADDQGNAIGDSFYKDDLDVPVCVIQQG